MNKKIGFLFDLDGVLIDSEKEYTSIWAEIDRQFPSGIANLPLIIKGMTLKEIVDTYFPKPEWKEAVPDLLNKLENKMRFEWLPGAKETLMKLKNKNYPTVLVTSSNKDKMRLLYNQLPEIKSFFNYIITGDKVKKSKPDPEGYLLGASMIECCSVNCAVFEDSLQGVKAGKEAGAFVVGIEGTVDREKLLPFCNIVIPSVGSCDLDNLIFQLLER